MNPSKTPSIAPTKTPTSSPTTVPSKSPSIPPTKTPTHSPTTTPTHSPSKSPTTIPSKSPSIPPTSSPTLNPSTTPTKIPSKSPTISPTKSPSIPPTKTPTLSPNTIPTTKSPTLSPTKYPTSKRPTINTPDFCLSGADFFHGNASDYQGHYVTTGTYNERDYYSERINKIESFVVYFNTPTNEWYLSETLGGTPILYCANTEITLPRDCENNWFTFLNDEWTDLYTSYGECNKVVCSTITVQSSGNSNCNGVFDYVSDNLFNNAEEGYYWGFNDYYSVFICANNVASINSGSGFLAYSVSVRYPQLVDGDIYSVSMIFPDTTMMMVLECDGCSGNDFQVMFILYYVYVMLCEIYID